MAAGGEWVTQREAAEILGVSAQVMKTVVRAGGVAVRKLPGARTQLSRADVERLARESVRPAGPAREGGGAGG